MIELHDVCKTYRVTGREILALQSIRLNIQTGQIFSLIGYSGVGKSTLLRLINHLEGSSGDRILVEGEDVTILDVEGLRRFRRRVGMIFQHFNLLSLEAIADNIAMPLRLVGGFGRVEVDAWVSELLAQVGLSDHARRYPVQLSSGQKQRVGIARALTCRPSVLFCDEATSALDPQAIASVLQLLAEINRELKLIVVLITHEMDMIRRVCDQVAIMDGGTIVEQGDVADALLHPQHPTTHRFVFEVERIDEDRRHDDFVCMPGLILRLTFRGEATHVSLLSTVTRQIGIDYSILSGRIDRIKDTPYSQLTLTLVGGDLEAAVDQLNTADVHVEVLC